MKLNLKGIKFKTWLYFLGFSLVMLTILGVLLIAFIKPYYRENRLATIDTIAETIESDLLTGKVSEDKVEKTNRLVNGNNVCVLILNENGYKVYESDSLGELCMLDEDISIDSKDINIEAEPNKIIDILNNEDLSMSLSGDNNLEMLLYGRKIKDNLANYYLIINTPLELLESYIDFIVDQYFFIALVIIVLSLVVSFILANKLSSPIVKMQKEANKLASGHYDADFKDIESFSEINALASTLDDATNKLSKVDELRKDLVANVSHDLKTPITLIRSYAEMIKDISGDDPIKRNEHLDVIIDETKYLTKLIDDMKEYSKMQAGYIELHKSNFDLKKCTNSVCKLLDGLLKEKNIKLKKKLTSVIVYADETKISQVIYNYLSNAIKHSYENSKITISIIDSEDNVRFEVKDEGEGIDEKDIPYLWDRYYKIDKSFRRNENSTGLGLAIAKAILEGHKAKYGVDSTLGKGSTFYFELSKDYDDETE